MILTYKKIWERSYAVQKTFDDNKRTITHKHCTPDNLVAYKQGKLKNFDRTNKKIKA